MPVTTPVVGTTVATAVLLLLHVPPPTLFVNDVVSPAQILAVPPIEAGLVLTVILFDVKQPVPSI